MIIQVPHLPRVYYLIEPLLLQGRMASLEMTIGKKNVSDDRSRAHMAAGQLIGLTTAKRSTSWD